MPKNFSADSNADDHSERNASLVRICAVIICVCACFGSGFACWSAMSAGDTEYAALSARDSAATERIETAKTVEIPDSAKIGAIYEEMGELGDKVVAYQNTGEGAEDAGACFMTSESLRRISWSPGTSVKLTWTFAPSQEVDDDGLYPASWVGRTPDGTMWVYATARFDASKHKFKDLKRVFTREGASNIEATPGCDTEEQE